MFMQVLTAVALVVGLVLTTSGIVAVVWSVGKVRGVEASIDILNAANEGLRASYTDLEKAEVRNREHFLVQIASQEKECSTRLARLEGQVDTLTGTLAERIVAAVADAAAKAKEATT